MSSKPVAEHHLQKEDNCALTFISDSSKIQSVSSLKQFLISCYGPSGKTKYIQNRHGALMALSCSSKRLLSNSTFVSPISQLVASSIQQHLAAFSDSGLFMGILMLSLVEGSITENIHSKLCGEINTLLMDVCLEAMGAVAFQLDLSNMGAMLSLVSSIFESKTSGWMNMTEIKLLSSLVLQAVVSSLPNEIPKNIIIPHIEFHCIGGQSVTKTHLMTGVIVEVSKNTHIALEAWTAQRCSTSIPIKLALFNTSLAVDEEPLPGVSLESDRILDVEEFEMVQMKSFADKLKLADVSFVGCQKVIHPSLVKMLTERGILCVDRLSLVHIGAVQKLTGASLLSSMNCDLLPGSLGLLSDVTSCWVFDQRFLHLTSSMKSVTTVILCHQTETCLEELKHIFGVALHIACLSICHCEVVPGAGLLEEHLVRTVQEKAREVAHETSTKLGCSQHQFMKVTEVFVSSLECIRKSLFSGKPSSRSVSPSAKKAQSHSRGEGETGEGIMNFKERLYKFDADCHKDDCTEFWQPITAVHEDRRVTNQNQKHRVVDLLLVKRNAFKMAVEMANLILSIGAVSATPL